MTGPVTLSSDKQKQKEKPLTRKRRNHSGKCARNRRDYTEVSGFLNGLG